MAITAFVRQERLRGLDVGGQPPQARSRHAGRQVRHPSGREDDGVGAVADRARAPEPPLPRPPDPAVACRRPERARLPAARREPGPAMRRDMAEALADDAAEPQAVTPPGQTVPEPVPQESPWTAGRHMKTKWPPPKSKRAGHRADNKIVLRDRTCPLTLASRVCYPIRKPDPALGKCIWKIYP